MREAPIQQERNPAAEPHHSRVVRQEAVAGIGLRSAVRLIRMSAWGAQQTNAHHVSMVCLVVAMGWP
jgi:hypothetical protein